MATRATAHVVAITLSAHDASSTLFFRQVQGLCPDAVRIVEYGRDDLARAIAGASAIVLVRGLFEFGSLLACARRIGIPFYYFVDDNFMVIREESDNPLFRDYTDERVRDALNGAEGVLLPTTPLMEYFAERRLHDRLLAYPPIAGPVLPRVADTPARAMTIAFFGGQHRREAFLRVVYPAIRRLGKTQRVRLLTPGIQAGLTPAEDVELVDVPYNPSYAAALSQAAQFGVDILVHPGGTSANNMYKNPHVLINARALRAVPVFSDAPPYDALAAEQVAVTCENNEDAWFRALATLAHHRDVRREFLARIDRYCDAHFNGETNAAILRAMLSDHPSPGTAMRARRRVAAAGCLGVGRAVRVGRRITRAINQA